MLSAVVTVPLPESVTDVGVKTGVVDVTIDPPGPALVWVGVMVAL
jgi:hypothetical protein